MPLSRRHFLSVLGGGAIVAAGSLGGFALTRTPREALAPWSLAGSYEEPRRYALSHGILAPNPHNLQPWLVDLSENDAVTLYPDPARRLPETDPFDRQITIGLGCFLEQTRIAASHKGYEMQIELFPQGSDPLRLGSAPVAHCRFIEAGVTTDPLFDAIARRRSTKEPFDMDRPVPAAALAPLDPRTDGIRFAATIDENEVDMLRRLIWQAWEVEYETPATHHESVALMRLGKAEINALPDGIDLGGPFLEGLMLTGLMTREDLATPGTTSYQAGYDIYRPMFEATPAFVWLASGGNSREDQIAAGRAWLRLNLSTTASGLALHPVSQCLQEFPEMAEHYRNAHRALAREGETVQMLGRLGYAAPVTPSPRWSLDAKIKHS
jgi:hypothetical protein